MSISYSSQFPRCLLCGKPRLPQGLILLTYGTTSVSPYCTGHSEQVQCPHCGSMVNPCLHPFKACQYFQQLYPMPQLREDDVLAEAEAILRDARTDGKWEGAD